MSLVSIVIETSVQYRHVPVKRPVCAYIRRVTESGPHPTSRCVQNTPTMRTQYRCVLLYDLSACMHIRHMAEPSPTRRHLPALLVRDIICPSTSRVQEPILPPSPSESSPPPQPNRNWASDPLDVISSRHILTSHRHPDGSVRVGARYTRHSPWRSSFYCSSRRAHASRTMRQ